MIQPKTLSALLFVAGQVQPDDMVSLAASGIVTVINNRPDYEEPGQPSSAEIEAAAREAGLDYLYAPVRGIPDEQAVLAVAARLREDTERGARTLMFCRSGMRSAAVWAMAQRLDGVDADTLRDTAAVAGYDLGHLPL